MSEYRGLSRLPADPEYWNALESRILADAPERVLDPFARWSWAVGSLAAAALLAAVLLAPPRERAAVRHVGFLSVPAGAELLLAPAAPPVLAPVWSQTEEVH